jgi:hypothetical protein
MLVVLNEELTNTKGIALVSVQAKNVKERKISGINC